ncbi:SET domain-containing protein-lysine N-methyltransferase [Pusillimonas caeni]|uniref:SET domain-containing protein n=1 Tax=Pusillimonas caeni TaxID=1348472 RepID=UPI000E59DA56|nr:SET domain-containing protein-lysine N-methyltransferase [Pusillimonas caeni]TFL14475.1 SET domain-containing protein-lysine N-methyltransferase [Pusillimonas caeni]
MSKTKLPWHTVRRSPLHGNGVFAARDIPAGTRIIEYTGTRITPEQADERHPANPDDPFHTFYFSLSGGKVIDGGDKGNDARWINHSCAPNCETEENASGTRVYVMALRDIDEGEELFYDYGLVMEGKITKKLRAQYLCLCGSENCRGTMLALPEKKSTSKKKAALEAKTPSEAKPAPQEKAGPEKKKKDKKKEDKKKGGSKKKTEKHNKKDDQVQK